MQHGRRRVLSMSNEQVSEREQRLQHDLQDTIHEQDLLWTVVAAVQACAGGLAPSRLDALLAGCTSGWPTVPVQRTRPR